MRSFLLITYPLLATCSIKKALLRRLSSFLLIKCPLLALFSFKIPFLHTIELFTPIKCFSLTPILHQKGFVTPYLLFSSNLTLFFIKTLCYKNMSSFLLIKCPLLAPSFTVKKSLLLECEHFSANYMIFTDTNLYQKGLIVTK